MSLALNRILPIWHFECGGASEIWTGKIFDFYLGPPHYLYQIVILVIRIKNYSVKHQLCESCIDVIVNSKSGIT